MVSGSYRIGEYTIQITASETVNGPKNMEKFRATDEAAEKKSSVGNSRLGELRRAENSSSSAAVPLHYVLQMTDQIGAVMEQVRRRQTGAEICREDLTILYTEQGECRFLKFHGADWVYAVSEAVSAQEYHIFFSERVRELLNLDTVFWSPFCLERLAMEQNALILHSAYMCRKGKAVLFSAPSGIGKSTQAGLWERYRGTRTINGDRSLLLQKPDGWYAAGWPICGSSEICNNEAFPLEAIVMLSQSPQNRIRRLRGAEAFRELFPQITVNAWNREFQTKAMDCLEQLLSEIPVYHLACNISEDAVCCLEKCLENWKN